MENAENEAYKNAAQGIRMSLVNQTQTWPEQQRTQIQNNLPPIAPYTHYYQQQQQYLNHFTPYYYNYALLNYNYNNNFNNNFNNLSYSYPTLMATKMDIEKYINYELRRQQNLMKAKQQNPPPPPPPPATRPALVPQPQFQPISRKVAPRKVPQEKRVLNVQVVAMATSPRDKSGTVEPLPPVKDAFRERVAKIDRSQQHYERLFGRLSSMLHTLNRRYSGHEPEPEPEPEPEAEAVAVEAVVPKAAPGPPKKRPRHESSSSQSSESQMDAENGHLSHYPLRIKLEDGNAAYVLGPNGTQITGQQYGQIFWTDAPVATRCLLSVVFSSDELATHTLTGKPSPAFYGRERPAKKMLDQGRVDDIVLSVRNRTGGKERNIRATITTKCADTAKKYKRRAKKASNAPMIVIDE